MKTGYKVVYDTGARMYECPDCECRLIADPFDTAVGNWGYRYCPYCGTKLEGRQHENTGLCKRTH